MEDINLIKQFGSFSNFCSFVKSGTLYDKCCALTKHNTEINTHNGKEGYLGDTSINEWIRLTKLTYKHLTENNEIKGSSEITYRRVLHYYLPLYFWIKRMLIQWELRDNKKNPVVPIVGLSSPQGSGKTTLVNCLKVLFDSEGYKTCVISLDDFYLTYEDQKVLNSRFPGNELLEFRGNAGTHDISLANTILKSLKEGTSDTGYIAIPAYNKAAFMGAGDRFGKSEWPKVKLPIKLVIIEGWMLGFKALPESHQNLKITGLNSIYQVNHYLWKYDSIHQLIDAWIVIKIDDLEIIYKWRQEAEMKLQDKIQQKGGMSPDKVIEFVNRFMPAYNTYLPELYEYGPSQSNSLKPYLRFFLNKDRLVDRRIKSLESSL